MITSDQGQNRDVETPIIGTGCSGLLAAVRLKKNACNDFVLLERSAELGGVASQLVSRAEVDVPTSLYSISFVPYPFTKTFASQTKLLAYTNHVIDTFGLRKHAITNQNVTSLTYDEVESRWHVETASGERYTARFVVDASGVLAKACTAFYRKNMTDEITSLSPESVIGFILSRKWFRLDDYRLLT